MNWKKLTCGVVAGMGLVGCGGGTDFAAYEGRVTVLGIYPEVTRTLTREDSAWLHTTASGININTNPDLCPLVAFREDNDALRIDPGTECILGAVGPEREGHFIAVLDEQSISDRDGVLTLDVHGTIHENDAQSPSMGEFILSFHGTLKQPTP